MPAEKLPVISDECLGPIARAQFVELETAGLKYSEKMQVLGQVFAALVHAEVARIQARGNHVDKWGAVADSAEALVKYARDAYRKTLKG